MGDLFNSEGPPPRVFLFQFTQGHTYITPSVCEPDKKPIVSPVMTWKADVEDKTFNNRTVFWWKHQAITLTHTHTYSHT